MKMCSFSYPLHIGIEYGHEEDARLRLAGAPRELDDQAEGQQRPRDQMLDLSCPGKVQLGQHPGFVIHTAAQIAHLKDISIKDVIEANRKSVQEIYGIKI